VRPDAENRDSDWRLAAGRSQEPAPWTLRSSATFESFTNLMVSHLALCPFWLTLRCGRYKMICEACQGGTVIG
jgi:hypothetical protein